MTKQQEKKPEAPADDVDPRWKRDPIAASPISAIVPVTRDAKLLPEFLAALAAELAKLNRAYEIILVNDAGNAARSACDDLARQHANTSAIHHDAPQGYGAALKAGLAQAKHPLMFTIPGDAGYSPADLPKFLAAIDRVDIVLGQRPQRSWFARKLGGWGAYLLFGLWVKDVCCPVRLYRKSAFDRIVLQSQSAFADVEILAKANYLERLLDEVEVTWRPSDVKEPSSFGDLMQVFRKPEFGGAK
jgi:glycosyltransferase involved in cell wall biosynthesis